MPPTGSRTEELKSSLCLEKQSIFYYRNATTILMSAVLEEDCARAFRLVNDHEQAWAKAMVYTLNTLLIFF